MGIESYPMNWPIGMGKEFLGIYDRFYNRIEQFRVDESERYLSLNDEGGIEGDAAIKQNLIIRSNIRRNSVAE